MSDLLKRIGSARGADGHRAHGDHGRGGQPGHRARMRLNNHVSISGGVGFGREEGTAGGGGSVSVGW
jgi:hypothetical protein